MAKNVERVDENKHCALSKKEGYVEENKRSIHLRKIIPHCLTSIDNCLLYFDFKQRLWSHFSAFLDENNYLFYSDLQNYNVQKTNDLYVSERRYFRTIFNLFVTHF